MWTLKDAFVALCFAQARLRRLVVLLEGCAGVELAHPLPWPMRTAPAAEDEEALPSGEAGADTPVGEVHGCCFFVGVRFAARAAGGEAVDLRPAGAAFVSVGSSWDDRASTCPSARMLVRVTARTELPEALRRRSSSSGTAGEYFLPCDDPHDAAALRGRDLADEL